MDMGYYVNAENEVKLDMGNGHNEIPYERGQFLDKESAQGFIEHNTVPLSRFVLDKNLHPEPKQDRRKRMGEPPIVTDEGKNLINKDMFVGKPEPDVEALAHEGFVSDDQNPNMRSFENPDARYVGAQIRSARVSGLHPSASVSNGGWSRSIPSTEIIDGKKAIVRTKFRILTEDGDLGYLHDFNLPAYEDDDVIIYFENGVVHRDADAGPAVIFKDGITKYYVYYGLLHNPNGPAAITEEAVSYYQNGLLHNRVFPAVVYSSGKREYWEKGEHLRTVEAPPAEASEFLSAVADHIYSDDFAEGDDEIDRIGII